MKEKNYANQIRNTGTQVVKAVNGTPAKKTGQVRNGNLRDGGKK